MATRRLCLSFSFPFHEVTFIIIFSWHSDIFMYSSRFAMSIITVLRTADNGTFCLSQYPLFTLGPPSVSFHIESKPGSFPAPCNWQKVISALVVADLSAQWFWTRIYFLSKLWIFNLQLSGFCVLLHNIISRHKVLLLAIQVIKF